ncbi:protein SPIRAL1-like 3 [Salvia miltiorrhiza]|uniref:protein SPIRAL1-like 3 n=1 Tax=Salvia miltiorrhiza TaxID=226208 RepID=UPI0025AD07F8|nr:protein SPIRAL1-like 3 [Salvia miltiorrhiza]XP_057768593.1 protein SPIRAL1-like 3 [Salvia miltiorrhiza]XP_057768594.1 protein SPIRAL1-like 3 [Salvia miltiorrhiza]
MGRGVSAGGGQSSLGYLFGGGEAAAPPPTTEPEYAAADADKNKLETHPTATATTTTTNSATNNYHRSDGQNCGNFITDRPSTKVHAEPGGGSSLNYLFGDAKK